MKGYIFLICSIMISVIMYTHANLEYKGYPRAQACTGECYAEYQRVNGTLAEQMEMKREIANADPFSAIRGLWGGCAACHGQSGQGMGAFPKLAGKDSEYISQRLYAYQNRETIGNMSSMMWAQASQLSDQDIETLGNFIQETMNE